MGRLVIDGNAVYEIDEACEKKRREQKEDHGASGGEQRKSHGKGGH